MKITDLTIRLHSRRYESNLRNSRHPWKEKHALLVFVETESGHVGVGEAWCENGSPEPLGMFIERDLKSLVVGLVLEPGNVAARLLETDAMSNKGGFLYAAVSAIDIAMHDALARSRNIPLYQLLSHAHPGQGRGYVSCSVPVYCSSGMYGDGYTPEKLAREMGEAFRRGFCGVKIKGGGASLEEDVERARAVRAAIGAEAKFMVDVLWSLDVERAIALAKALGPFGLHFLEAPTDRHDLEGWRRIRDEGRLALAGPEIEHGVHNFRNMLPLVEFLQADAIVCGGFGELKKIHALAVAANKPLSLHCSGSAVALAANAHFAAAIGDADGVEMHLLHQSLFERLWEGGYRIADGRLHLPDGAGLGLELSPDDPALWCNE